MFTRIAIAFLLIISQVSSAGTVPYIKVVDKVADMILDSQIWHMVNEQGLDIVNVTWEDTGRYYGSCWGPNISDLTIQVHSTRENSEYPTLTCMPVIRYPNFHDISADLDPDNFLLLVGNEIDEELAPVSLTDLVGNIRLYLNDPTSWSGTETGLIVERDSVVLVSAQAVFLPIEESGTAVFNPVLYNYQSVEDDPAVLTILATREGTSITVIDNARDAIPGSYSWGQRLFFNENGQRACFSGERLSDFRENTVTSDNLSIEVSEEEGLNMVLLIQIPLKQKNPQNTYFDSVVYYSCVSVCDNTTSTGGSDIEAAVIGHGELEGPFTEIDNLEIERDPDFPIRVTVQFYKATSNGLVTQEDIDQIAEEIDRVYADASYVGSLVVPAPESYRPTDWDRASVPRRLFRCWEMYCNSYLSWINRIDLSY